MWYQTIEQRNKIAEIELPAYYAGYVVFTALAAEEAPSRQSLGAMRSTLDVQRIASERLGVDGSLPSQPGPDLVDYMANNL